MIRQFGVLVVLLCAVNQGMTECQDKPPMANYSSDLVPGKFYLIITKPGFAHQYNELRCSTSEIKSAAPVNFDLVITFQDSDGTVTTLTPNVTNLDPPGTWYISSAVASFQASVIGSIKGKVNIYYACNSQNGKEAVWVYYYEQVNGLYEMDATSLQYTLKTLNQNGISTIGFRMVYNKNCNT